MQGVIETDDYLADAKKVGLSEEDRDAIVEIVARNPVAGDLIRGSGGARKLRYAPEGSGKGKSSGVRVITFFGGDDIPVFLMNVFAKGEKANLSAAETNELKAILRGDAKKYRETSKARAKARGINDKGR